jgi:DNA-binding CsgD family transcriptional regulator
MASLLSDLKNHQLRQAVEVVHTLAAASDSTASFITGALDGLPALVPSDLTTLSVCDLNNRIRKVYGRQAEALSEADCAIFDRYFREHPLVRFHGSHPGGPTQRISDCADGYAFNNSALYADYYARLGITHVMALPLQIDEGNVVSIVFNRSGSDFSNAERAVFEAIRPPLSALYRNLIAREESKLALGRLCSLAAGVGWQMVRVTANGQILDAEPAGLRLLQRYFIRGGRLRSTALPSPIADWMTRARNWGLDRRPSTGESLTVRRFGKQLTIHFVADPAEPGRGYLLMKEAPAGVSTDALEPLPLTMREREVLALVATGKSNPEIGTLLGISARTVQKHLENMFQKLGVETRMAAALVALSVSGSEGASAGGE